MDPNCRFRPTFLFFMLTLLVLAMWTGPASAEIFIVDCDEGPDVDPWTHTTISAAVNAAATNDLLPDTIVVRPCVYAENVYIPAEAAGLHILAAEEVGPEEVLGAEQAGVGMTPSDPRPLVDGSGGFPFPSCFTVDAERVSIQGLELANCGNEVGGGSGVLALNNSKLLRLHDMEIRSLNGNGVEVQGADAPTLTSNWIYQVQQHGIFLHGVTDAYVADNVINGTSALGSAGILINGGSEDVHILNNEVHYAWGPGIHDRNAVRTRIERNTALDNCNGMLSPTCECDEILVGPATLLTDVAGNDADTLPNDGITLCSSSAEEKENPGM